MPLRTAINTITQLKELMAETFMNKTNKVTKVSDGGVVNGFSYGISKIAQKVQKDIALVESRMFPSLAFGQYLDDVAFDNGISPRFGATNSSTYILIVAVAGTTYVAGTHVFSGSSGVTFQLMSNVVIPSIGYAYVLVRSTVTGVRTNVDPLSISKVSPTPAGHIYVVNEFAALGGSDNESDISFQTRIRDTPNIIATDTLGRLTQVFIKYNSKVMRLFYYGINNYGQTKIAILTQDGSPLSGGELTDILEKSSQYLSLSDLRPFGSTQFGVELVNIDWLAVDFDFRIDLLSSFDPDVVRISMQVAVGKYLDYTKWTPLSKIDWTDLIAIIKSVDGVKYCPDTYFKPNLDISVSRTQLPRARSFIMRDLNGDVVSDSGSVLNPVYFPNRINSSYQSTVLITS